jgi:tetratricopeptide (TPR) repeat protein
MLADVYAQEVNITKLKDLHQNAFKNEALPFATKIGIFSNLFTLSKNIIDKPVDLEAILNQYISSYPKEGRPHIFKADMEVKANQLVAARESYKKAVGFDPSIFEAWLAIIELDVRMGSFQEMKKHTEKALVYFPNQAYFWYHSGFALMQLKEKEDALIAFEEAAKLSSKNKELSLNIQANMANLHAELGNIKKAATIFENILAIQPLHEQGLNDYSLFLISQKNAPKSLELAQKLVQSFSKQAANFETLALAYSANNQLPKAIEAVDKAIQMQENPKFYETKGDLLQLSNKPDEARMYWLKAKEKGHVSESLKQKTKS